MWPPVCPRLVLLLTLSGLMAACRAPTDKRFDFASGAPSRAGLVALADSVLVSNEAGRLVRLDRQGRTRWSVVLEREIASPPTVSGDSVVVGTVGGTLVSLTLAQGTERWRLTEQPAVLTPLVSDADLLYVVAPDGAVRCLTLVSGELRWRRALPPGAPLPDPQRPLPSPVLAGDLLVVALGDAGLFALSAEEGTLRWHLPLKQVLGMTARGDEALYVSTRAGEVLALALATGRPRWRHTEPAPLTSPPSLARDQLWVGTSEPALLALSLEEGREVSRLPLPAPLVTRVAQYQDQVWVPTRGGEGWLLALGPGQTPPLRLRLDTALPTQPVIVGDQVFIQGQDGRVLSWRLQPPRP